MKTSNQLSVSFRRVRQISQSALASSSLTTRATSSELTAPATAEVATAGASGLAAPREAGTTPLVVVEQRNARRRRGFVLKNAVKALAIILTPVLLAAFYVFVWATPMYVSETHFAVRGGEAMMRPGAGLSSMLASSNPLVGMVDGYSVRDFLQSREAMDKLDESVGFVSRVARRDADWLTRLSPEATRERTFRAYQSFVQVSFNMIEQIVVVRVFAYSAEDANILAKALTKLAEKFADEINKRAREDTLSLSESEMDRADRRVRDARLLLSDWRSKNANIDPTANVLMINTLIGTLENNLADLRSQLAILAVAAQDNPNRRSLEQRITIVREQIAEAKRRLTGSDSRSEAIQLTEYERLKIDTESAEKAREATRGALDDARVQVIRQQKYVFTVASPSRPDWAEWPSAYRFLGGGLIVGILLYIAVSLGGGMLRDNFS